MLKCFTKCFSSGPHACTDSDSEGFYVPTKEAAMTVASTSPSSTASTPSNTQNIEQDAPVPVVSQAPASTKLAFGRPVRIMTGCGKCVDIRWSAMKPGTPIWQFRCNNTAAQTFILEDAGGGKAYIKDLKGHAIDVKLGGTEPGTELILWEFHGGDNQKFNIINLDNGMVRISPQIAEHLAWEVNGGSHSSFTPIKLSPSNKHWSQSFSIVPV